MSEARSGACPCGAITCRVAGPMCSVTPCLCGECRRMAGHAWGSAVAPRAAIPVAGPRMCDRPSAQAGRGFLPRCGASPLRRTDGEEGQSVAFGSLDEPNALRLEARIFVGDKGDCHEVADGLPIRGG